MIDGHYSATVRVKVPFYDVDLMGIVWHGHYLKYFDIARSELMDSLDFGYKKMANNDLAWPIVKLGVKYVRPARLGSQLAVTAKILEFKTYLKIGYSIEDLETGEKLTQATTTQVAVDRKTGEIQQRWDAQARADSVKESMKRAEEENLFTIAYSDFTSGRFDLALAGFTDFIARYPASDRAPQAEYWAAECHYALKDYDTAQAAYAAYLKAHPDGDRLCAVLYKMGLIFERQGRQQHRTAVWKKLLSQCPQSEEARAAQSRMQ